MYPDIQINVGNIRVFHVSGTSVFFIGKGKFKNLSSHSKTNNGVGNAYGDGSYINMSPYQSTLNDSDTNDAVTKKDKYVNKTYEFDEESPLDYPSEWNDRGYKDLRF
jgi:hypothetical protein